MLHHLVFEFCYRVLTFLIDVLNGSPEQAILTLIQVVPALQIVANNVLHLEVRVVLEQNLCEVYGILPLLVTQQVVAHEVVEAERLDEGLGQCHLLD